MIPDEVVADIDRTIALWRREGLTAGDAWRALGLNMAWAVEWWEVRAFMVRRELRFGRSNRGRRSRLKGGGFGGWTASQR